MSKIENSISINNIGKSYKIYPSRKARVKEWFFPFLGKCHEDKVVLKDINLKVQAGEAVGIVGMNGAGKSTLLKIITGTTVPTTGTIKFKGTVSALLELGLGFHPDFSGRSNVYMSGQLLGYSIKEINECMEQVEQFAEIGDAIDAPVRTYSSGMQIRLAFSVATMKRPDILIVDEALSVGDTYFQHKSFGRIKKFCKCGTTLLLVSHDAGAIQAVCNRAVLLDHGEIKKIGNPQEVMDYYNAVIGGNDNKPVQQYRLNDGHMQTISGNGKASIKNVKLLDMNGQKLSIIDVGEHICLKITANINDDIEKLTCGILLKNRLGEAVYGTNTEIWQKSLGSLKTGDKVNFMFSLSLNLGVGNYSITVALHGGKDHFGTSYEWRDLACVFEVVNRSKEEFAGLVYLDTKIESEKIRR